MCIVYIGLGYRRNICFCCSICPSILFHSLSLGECADNLSQCFIHPALLIVEMFNYHHVLSLPSNPLPVTRPRNNAHRRLPILCCSSVICESASFATSFSPQVPKYLGALGGAHALKKSRANQVRKRLKRQRKSVLKFIVPGFADIAPGGTRNGWIAAGLMEGEDG